MPAYIYNQFGDVIISDHVIADIVSQSVMSSYGVVGLAFKNVTDGILTLLNKQNMARGVKILMGEKGLLIDLHVVLEYGVSMMVISNNIIENVTYNVESMTGIPVEKINVFIQGIRLH